MTLNCVEYAQGAETPQVVHQFFCRVRAVAEYRIHLYVQQGSLIETAMRNVGNGFQYSAHALGIGSLVRRYAVC